jgi:hypothetical protein
VNYDIVELEEFSGSKATVYSVILEGDNITLFDHFVDENKTENRKELKSIITRLQEIGQTTGAREKFFKQNEGFPGDGVCALYDDEESKLRLYCIRYGSVAIIVGGGGPKLPEVIAWQDDEKLSLEATTIIQVSKDIMQKLKDDELNWSSDGSQLLGNLTFTKDEDE